MATVRWNLAVSDRTDHSLRTFIASRGGRKGDLSRFVEDAVNRRLFEQAVADAKAANADVPEEELMAMIDEAIAWARAH